MENINELPKGLKEKYIFLENDFPIFFSCTDDVGNDYLGCYAAIENETIKFLISKVSSLTILEVLSNEKYLYDAFKESKFNFLVGSSNHVWNGEFKNEVEDHYLPTKNEYLDASLEDYKLEKNYYISKYLDEGFNAFVSFVNLHFTFKVPSTKMKMIGSNEFCAIDLKNLNVKQGGFNAKSA